MSSLVSTYQQQIFRAFSRLFAWNNFSGIEVHQNPFGSDQSLQSKSK